MDSRSALICLCASALPPQAAAVSMTIEAKDTMATFARK
jgi:hypothetical protein